ncbi:DNA cytosine C5-methyltransferase [Geotalea daltonii FRC-32]|uniref:DNA (cytosine-5-)-methyltransferase n=1 Tax=Geotalea daltonii (strain DSM 22248 / JCM 15807 / FRC-32) TaxID=316067 RepID=B9M105_GEODF|nr:DNA cytosine methyltransferase [Geotalea daltonii]ACM19075.1 DNA cytosine C5-methyltransferase [Geotalea daltonii FRC-32]
MKTFYEFFAGGGMARIGLGKGWECVFANDFDPKKAISYRTYFRGNDHFVVEDVAKIQTSQLLGTADLTWASFPCQDLSLAGNGAGIAGERSGAFWPFWNVITKLRKEGRAPKTIILENVYGTVTSHDGKDLSIIIEELVKAGYRCGPMVIDAVLFLPHSRPRLFIIAIHNTLEVPKRLVGAPDPRWHPDALGLSYDLLSETARASWLWWNLPVPKPRTTTFSDMVENEPKGVEWHTPFETNRIIGMMSPINLEKLSQAKKAGKRVVGTIYKRTRKDKEGIKRQRAEVRFDDIAGCLRTPSGGSSRQIIILVEGNKVKTRLLSPREAARLMGLPESYHLPEKYNDAYHLAGDGVAVPVVRHIAKNIIEQVLNANKSAMRCAA